jgi:hypothetical protein
MVEEGREIQVGSECVAVTAQSIARTMQSLKLLQESIPKVLKPDVDYGHIPGIPGQMLKDSGAANIINFFNAYPGDRRILHMRDDGKVIAVCVEVPLISRESGKIIGSGVAASSTQEIKHKYRWVEDPADWGYNQEAIESWPKKDIRVEKGVTEYKIKNPEHSELLDIIIRQASKRAEADAARSLPGVGTALNILLGGKRQAPVDRPDWSRFWGECSKLGLSSEEVHAKLQVKSLSDWLAQGRTLEEAVEALRRAGEAPTAPGQVIPPERPKTEPTEASVKTFDDLYKVCFEFYKMQPADVIKELGYTSQHALVQSQRTPWSCWQEIRGIRQ